MEELLAKLEAAEGPDIALDCGLFAMAHDLPVPFTQAQAVEVADAIPLYTSSIDAAVSLLEQVLPGWERHITNTAFIGKKRVYGRADLRQPGQDRFGAGIIRCLPLLPTKPSPSAQPSSKRKSQNRNK